MWYNWFMKRYLPFALAEPFAFPEPGELGGDVDVGVEVDDLQARFALPMPPSINQQYATVRGRRVLSKDSRRYKKRVGKIIRRLRARGIIPNALVAALRQGYVGLFIDFYFETPLRRDLDGGLKITQDAICEALGLNDNRVVDLHLVKRIDPLRPRIEVQLEAIQDWQFDTEYVYLGDGS